MPDTACQGRAEAVPRLQKRNRKNGAETLQLTAYCVAFKCNIRARFIGAAGHFLILIATTVGAEIPSNLF